MSGASNPLDQVDRYVGLLSNPEKDRPADPPDGTRINGRIAQPDEVDVIKAAREQERARCAAMVAGIGRGRLQLGPWITDQSVYRN